jgi:cell wall-associated NlpC family hydrolase
LLRTTSDAYNLGKGKIYSFVFAKKELLHKKDFYSRRKFFARTLTARRVALAFALFSTAMSPVGVFREDGSCLRYGPVLYTLYEIPTTNTQFEATLMNTLLLATGLFYVTDPAVTMRETPADTSKVASQAVFAEQVQVGERKEGWCSITTPDGYQGWIRSRSIVEVEKPYEPTTEITRLTAHIYGVTDTEYGPIMTLPYGSRIQVIDESNPRWISIKLPDGKLCYVQRGDIAPEPALNTKDDLVEFSKKFIGLPYTWGGRTGFGYDCSGFVQKLYKRRGVNLLRDSKQQVLDSRFATVDRQKLEAGDLIFFGKADGRIVHVGMYLGNDEFIHATVRENQPWIHISNLSDKDWNGTGSDLPTRVFRQLIVQK